MLTYENPSRSAVSEILRPAHLAPTTMTHSNHLSSLRSDLCFELQKIILTMSACIDALCCCHVIGGYLCYWTGAPKKVAGECICALNYSCQRMYVYLCNALRAFKNFWYICSFVVWMVNCSVHLWETLIRRLNTPNFKGITDPKNKTYPFSFFRLIQLE